MIIAVAFQAEIQEQAALSDERKCEGNSRLTEHKSGSS